MANKIRENDYLHISARIHTMENRLLTRERMGRMLDARTADEAAKVLGECGYEELTDITPTSIERTLSQARLELFAQLRKLAPDPALVDVFCIKYDYHNLKVLLKARALGLSSDTLLLNAGRYDTAALQEALSGGTLERVSDTFRAAAERAGECLAHTGDPQLADFILDRAYYAELLEAARTVGSGFLTDYVRVSIDAANLRAAVRARRMGQGPEFLHQVLVEGGRIGAGQIVQTLSSGGDLAALFARTPLESAAAVGVQAMQGGPLTQFERLCDDAVTAAIQPARRVPFGEQPLVGYLYAKENEFTAIRIILTGKLAGLDRATIEERLRESYA